MGQQSKIFWAKKSLGVEVKKRDRWKGIDALFKEQTRGEKKKKGKLLQIGEEKKRIRLLGAIEKGKNEGDSNTHR